MSPSTDSTTRSLFTRRRSALLASVFGIAVLGFAAGQVILPPVSSPALAQITTDRPAGQYSFADVVERVRPAVVSVRTKIDGPRTSSMEEDAEERGPGQNVPPNMERFFRRFFGDQPNSPNSPMPRNRRVTGQGSGFFISADGFVVTNNHVIDKATTVEVIMDDGKVYTAKVLGRDQRTDLALLKIDGRTDFPWVKIATSQPRIGDWVLAVGNPFGLGGTVTAGIVSARGRDIGAGPYDDFLQIDAAVNRGNSGGPTFNLAGEVIGVNTAIVSPTGGNIGIAFAIPAETVSRVVASLKESGIVTRGFMGVNIQPVTAEIAESLGLKEPQGALVADVQADSPAAKAGIKSGDVVMAVNGTRIKDARELSRRISLIPPGTTVKLSVMREGKERNVDVLLAKLPEDRTADRAEPRGRDRDRADRDRDRVVEPRLGLSMAPAKSVAGAGDIGVVITEVKPDGPAAERGLKSGDVILEVAGKAVSTPADIRDAFSAARTGGKGVVLMRVKTEQGTRFVTVPVGRG
ncbi:MAG TPA: Do family serine endopeptidase [Xanthobacteraceae bacterium]|jgi:serine protease Do